MNRQALHRLLDAVIDKIEENDGYVAMDLSSYSLGVRAADTGGGDWIMYRDCFGDEYCRENVINDIIAELDAVEFSDTKQEADTTVDE